MEEYVGKIIIIAVVVILAIGFWVYSSGFFSNISSETAKQKFNTHTTKITFLNPSGFPITFTYDQSSNSYVGYIKFEIDTKVNQTPFTILNAKNFKTEIVKVEKSGDKYVYTVKVIIPKDEAKKLEKSGIIVSTNSGAYAYFEANLVDNSGNGDGSGNVIPLPSIVEPPLGVVQGSFSVPTAGYPYSLGEILYSSNIVEITGLAGGYSVLDEKKTNLKFNLANYEDRNRIISEIFAGIVTGNTGKGYSEISNIMRDAFLTLEYPKIGNYISYATEFTVIKPGLKVSYTRITLSNSSWDYELYYRTVKRMGLIKVAVPFSYSWVNQNATPEDFIYNSPLVRRFDMSLVKVAGKIIVVENEAIVKEFSWDEDANALKYVAEKIKPGYSVLILGVNASDTNIEMPNDGNFYLIDLSNIGNVTLKDGTGGSDLIIRFSKLDGIEFNLIRSTNIITDVSIIKRITGNSMIDSSIALDTYSDVNSVSVTGGVINSSIDVDTSNQNAKVVLGNVDSSLLQILGESEIGNVSNSFGYVISSTENGTTLGDITNSFIKLGAMMSSRGISTGDITNSKVTLIISSSKFVSINTGGVNKSEIILPPSTKQWSTAGVVNVRGSFTNSDFIASRPSPTPLFIYGNVSRSTIYNSEGMIRILNTKPIEYSNITTGLLYVKLGEFHHDKIVAKSVTNIVSYGHEFVRGFANPVIQPALGVDTSEDLEIPKQAYVDSDVWINYQIHGAIVLENTTFVFSGRTSIVDSLKIDNSRAYLFGNFIIDGDYVNITNSVVLSDSSNIRTGTATILLENTTIVNMNITSNSGIRMSNVTAFSVNLSVGGNISIDNSVMYGVNIKNVSKIEKASIDTSKVIDTVSSIPMNVTNSYVISSSIPHGQVWVNVSTPQIASNFEFGNTTYEPNNVYVISGDNVTKPTEPAGTFAQPGKYVFVIDAPLNYTLSQPMFHDIPKGSTVTVYIKKDANITKLFSELNGVTVNVILGSLDEKNKLPILIVGDIVSGDVNGSDVRVYIENSLGIGKLNSMFNNVVYTQGSVVNSNIHVIIDKKGTNSDGTVISFNGLINAGTTVKNTNVWIYTYAPRVYIGFVISSSNVENSKVHLLENGGVIVRTNSFINALNTIKNSEVSIERAPGKEVSYEVARCIMNAETITNSTIYIKDVYTGVINGLFGYNTNRIDGVNVYVSTTNADKFSNEFSGMLGFIFRSLITVPTYNSKFIIDAPIIPLGSPIINSDITNTYIQITSRWLMSNWIRNYGYEIFGEGVTVDSSNVVVKVSGDVSGEGVNVIVMNPLPEKAYNSKIYVSFDGNPSVSLRMSLSNTTAVNTQYYIKVGGAEHLAISPSMSKDSEEPTAYYKLENSKITFDISNTYVVNSYVFDIDSDDNSEFDVRIANSDYKGQLVPFDGKGKVKLVYTDDEITIDSGSTIDSPGKLIANVYMNNTDILIEDSVFTDVRNADITLYLQNSIIRTEIDNAYFDGSITNSSIFLIFNTTVHSDTKYVETSQVPLLFNATTVKDSRIYIRLSNISSELPIMKADTIDSSVIYVGDGTENQSDNVVQANSVSNSQIYINRCPAGCPFNNPPLLPDGNVNSIGIALRSVPQISVNYKPPEPLLFVKPESMVLNETLTVSSSTINVPYPITPSTKYLGVEISLFMTSQQNTVIERAILEEAPSINVIRVDPTKDYLELSTYDTPADIWESKIKIASDGIITVAKLEKVEPTKIRFKLPVEPIVVLPAVSTGYIDVVVVNSEKIKDAIKVVNLAEDNNFEEENQITDYYIVIMNIIPAGATEEVSPSPATYN